jgi:nucleoside-diphosphate-sugar epimerase
MKTIGVIGANGKVGTELCLTLSLLPGIRPLAICRTALSAALLERCGIECRIGSLDSQPEAESLLRDCDTVVDLSLPRGSVSEGRETGRRVIRNAIAGSPPHAKYVFASTYMVLGMTEPGERFRRRFLAGSSYGASKRILEKAAFAIGREHRKEVYVLRFGQVHGEIQPVSRVSLDIARHENKVSVPPGPSNTVFVFTIAEAIAGIAEGKERPGLYTMTSDPQWSWRELHSYFAGKVGRNAEIIEEPLPVPASSMQQLRGALRNAVVKRRELWTGYVLPHFPGLERKAKAQYAVRSARTQIAETRDAFARPYHYTYSGEAPGKRLVSPSDSRITMAPFTAQVRRLLDDLLP